MRSRMAGVGVEQMFYTLQAGMFYTLQAGLWWGDCGGNVLHLHLICANNDDKHAGQVEAFERQCSDEVVPDKRECDADPPDQVVPKRNVAIQQRTHATQECR